MKDKERQDIAQDPEVAKATILQVSLFATSDLLEATTRENTFETQSKVLLEKFRKEFDSIEWVRT